jgi:glucose-1-phosphate cytidylyltransferase
MVTIGGQPLLWHIMKHYAHYGFKEFLIAFGYKGEVIKRFFVESCTMDGSMTIQSGTGALRMHERPRDDWTVHLIDTGLNTATGGRLKRLESWLRDGPFLLTYGDGVSNIPLDRLVRLHQARGCVGTVTAVRPPARFGELVLDGDRVTRFTEKPQIGEGWINGGFMVLEPAVFDTITGDEDGLEAVALERLAAGGKLAAYRHEGFWQCIDTLREKRFLENLWQCGKAPWRIWE